MIRCAPQRHGAPGEHGTTGGASFFFAAGTRGFTLLEMCFVLLIMAILVGMSMPSIQSALNEQAVRRDTHQLAVLVKTAMIQAAEQHRPYVIDLSVKSMMLHPLGVTTAATADLANTATFDDTTETAASGPVDVEAGSELNPPNKLLTPDLKKVNAWVPVPEGTEWTFLPGELCPATRIRVSRGDSWVEMSFNALTGDVQDETFSLQ